MRIKNIISQKQLAFIVVAMFSIFSIFICAKQANRHIKAEDFAWFQDIDSCFYILSLYAIVFICFAIFWAKFNIKDSLEQKNKKLSFCYLFFCSAVALCGFPVLVLLNYKLYNLIAVYLYCVGIYLIFSMPALKKLAPLYVPGISRLKKNIGEMIIVASLFIPTLVPLFIPQIVDGVNDYLLSLILSGIGITGLVVHLLLNIFHFTKR